jgi:hypothetical protein
LSIIPNLFVSFIADSSGFRANAWGYLFIALPEFEFNMT